MLSRPLKRSVFWITAVKKIDIINLTPSRKTSIYVATLFFIYTFITVVFRSRGFLVAQAGPRVQHRNTPGGPEPAAPHLSATQATGCPAPPATSLRCASTTSPALSRQVPSGRATGNFQGNVICIICPWPMARYTLQHPETAADQLPGARQSSVMLHREACNQSCCHRFGPSRSP